ncbi:MAG TPA: LacI family DNA-binding transcriptional regulator, partial [Armatimonadota bacterium]|nr:LacI family DNA-binding transcriptional regulator [Armatimonadota bacterium]
MATVYDVAEKAGVSIATVSRAMRGQDSVTAEARDRVLAAARELGYRPNRLAQTLARPAENTLGIMLPSDFTHPFYAMLTDEMTKSALAHSYDVVIGVSGRPTVEGFVDAATDLEDRRITGMLLCGNAEAVAGYVDTRRPEAPPTVLVGGIAGAGLPLVSVDEEQGGYDATRYLIEAGHERIGFLGLTANTYRTNGREHGYTRAIEEAGLEPAMRGVVVTMDAGRREVCAMMQEHSDLTALVAFNDAVALGAIRGLAD